MKKNAKSSITLPPGELAMVNGLMKRLGAKSKVEVIRRGLKLLQETTDRKALREAYWRASEATRAGVREELAELDDLNDEGIT
jgi:Arc/MetJ-type ribon-helix-helix transcriptional regulator